jgi:hypothetical protein
MFMSKLSRLRGITVLAAVGVVAACGSSASPGGATASASPDPSGTVAAAGDIPDNVVWLAYSGAGFSIQYPEGWVRSTISSGAAFSDKDSRITVATRMGASAPTTESVTAEIAAMAGARITRAAHQVLLTSGPAIAVTYEIDGITDPVTGKRPRLTVDRYELGARGHVAVLDLAAQIGVDNVDAYLAIARSFKWSP